MMDYVVDGLRNVACWSLIALGGYLTVAWIGALVWLSILLIRALV